MYLCIFRTEEPRTGCCDPGVLKRGKFSFLLLLPPVPGSAQGWLSPAFPKPSLHHFIHLSFSDQEDLPFISLICSLNLWLCCKAALGQLWHGASFSQPCLRAAHVFNAVIFTLHALRADPKPFEISGKLSLGSNRTLISPLISYTSIIAQQESEGRTLHTPVSFFLSCYWKTEWRTSLRYSKKVGFFPFMVSQKSTAPFVFLLFVPSHS